MSTKGSATFVYLRAVEKLQWQRITVETILKDTLDLEENVAAWRRSSQGLQTLKDHHLYLGPVRPV